MNIENTKPKALFPTHDGKIYPDHLICTSTTPAELNGKPSTLKQVFFLTSKFLILLNQITGLIRGKPGDLCPTCAKQQLSSLRHWQGHSGQNFPEELLALRLFKCRMWLWLVVPGIYDDDATKLLPQ